MQLSSVVQGRPKYGLGRSPRRSWDCLDDLAGGVTCREGCTWYSRRGNSILEIMQFVILLSLYLIFMAERNPDYLSWIEIIFAIYAFGWVLDQFATMLEHGW